MADADPAARDNTRSDERTVTVRELQDRSNRASWRIVSIVVAVIVAVFVLLGVALLSSNNGRDELSRPPVSSAWTSQPGSVPGPAV